MRDIRDKCKGGKYKGYERCKGYLRKTESEMTFGKDSSCRGKYDDGVQSELKISRNSEFL